jgi:hypothetical protein
MDRLGVGGGKPHEIADPVICGRCLGTKVTAVRELPAPPSTSYALRRLLLDLADGRTLDVFQKNYDISPHAPEVALSRGRRERYVYEHILSARELGTPELYGVLWDDSGGGHWLLLEFVQGRKLRRSLIEDRVAAAAWLGRLRGSVVGREAELAQSGLLLSYDNAYFWDTAERALQAVGARFGSLQRRLEAALTGYHAVIEKFSSGEPTLVHGSYRPRNIIVDTSSTDVRICPADWELTGLGPPLHDFAFLADGADRPWVERMWESYVAAAAASGLVVVQPDRMFEEIEGLRLHKALRSLARSADWDYPGDMVTKIVAKAEMIERGLG